MGPENDGEPNELVVLMKVLDILELRIQTSTLNNNETIQITQITNHLQPGSVIGDFIQDCSVTSEGDETIVGDKYNVHGNAQVGAIGKNASVDTVNFCTPDGEAVPVDLPKLVEELKTLRAELRGQASSTDDDLAVVSVGQAISAAEQGDGATAAGHLQRAGKWALGIATTIGTTIAAAAIKASLGL